VLTNRVFSVGGFFVMAGALAQAMVACAHAVEALDTTGSAGTAGAAGLPTMGAGGGSPGGGAGAGQSGDAGASSGAGASGGAGGQAGASAGGSGGGAGSGGAAGALGATGGAGGVAGQAGHAGASGNGGAGGNAGAGGGMSQPIGITTDVTSMPSKLQSANGNGTAFSQSCLRNEVIIGMTGTVDDPSVNMNYLRTFRAICATVSISGTTTYTAHTLEAETMPQPGTATVGSMTQTRLCGNDQIVVGFSGRSGQRIDQIGLVCAPLVVGGTAPSFTLSVGAPSPALLGLGGPGGGAFGPYDCGANQVAVGHTGRTSDFVDAFGLLCSTPSLVVQ